MMKVSLEKQTLIDISFQNVSVSVKTKLGEKKILQDISGICKHSEITAILGSSGAGKTTLLNALCNRIQNTKETSVYGKVQANSEEVTFENFSGYGSYVMQDDVLLETMTVKECLQFAADLKVQGNQSDKDQIVYDTIKSLKLEKCQNTMIGGRFVRRGISGGERKRTSIGFELVTNPNVLILDEPTSGLDSFTAYLLIGQLKKFATTKGKTVIFTIHSPSSDIWSMLDRVMLLVNGRFVYQGESNKSIINYFGSMGFECPLYQNPADYFMSILHNNEVNKQNYPRYFDSYDTKIKTVVQKQIEQKETLPFEVQKYQSSLFYQIGKLAQRSMNTIKRNRILFRARVIIAIIMSLILGLTYLRSEDGTSNPTSIRASHDRSGLLFFNSLSQLMMSLNPCIVSFPSMRAVFLRESNSKLYSVLPYFLGRLIVEIIPQIISPLIFGLIQFWMIGLNDKTAGNVFFYLFVLILQSLLGLALGYFGGAIFKDVKTAVMMKPLVFVPNVLFSGFYKNRKDYAKWIGWIEYIFPLKYSFNALIANEFEATQFNPDPVELLNLEFSKWNAVYILLGFIVGYLIISFIVLSRTKKRLQ